MKKSVQTIYFLWITLFLLLPVLVFLLVRGRLDTANYENRELALFPSVKAADIGQFPKGFDDWFSDHLPYRNQLLTLNGLFDYRVLKSSGNDSVLVGKDGWLFYKGSQVNGEDPVADYEGTNLFTEDELRTIADNMLDARRTLQQELPFYSDFVIYIAPNKERVYSEYMPDSYGEPSPGRMQQVIDYLRSHTDLKVVTPLDDLIAYKVQNPDTPIFFKYDTHWNELGAYIGAKCLNEALGKTQPDPSDITLVDGGQGTFDLARLIHLGKILYKDHAYVPFDYTPYHIEAEGNDSHTEYRFYNSVGDGDHSKLMIIGDSFSSFLSPYVACQYNNAYTCFYYNYNRDMLAQETPNVVVYETVERYLGNMLDFSLETGIGGSSKAGL